MLSPTKLAALLPSKEIGQSLYVFDELPSTNTFARNLANKHVPPAAAIFADAQTAGRGRLERKWFSPPGKNIYGSLIFYHEKTIKDLGWIPLMAGVVIAKALEECTALQIGLKWPNDIFIGERKVGGILCESFKNDLSETCVIIGFGINVNLSHADFTEDLRALATSLQIESQNPIDRHLLIAALIHSLERGWNDLIAHGTQACYQAYLARCVTIGRKIHIHYPDGSQLQGLADSIGPQGQLRVFPSRTDSQLTSVGLREIHSGDILHIRTPEER